MLPRVGECPQLTTLSMPTLRILVFDPSGMMPIRWAHWALYLPLDDECDSPGQCFGVRKRGFTSSKTQLDIIPALDIYDCENLQLHAEIEHINVSLEELTTICQNTARGRAFNLAFQNCQDWVVEVVKMLEDTLDLPKRVNVRELVKAKGYKPVRE